MESRICLLETIVSIQQKELQKLREAVRVSTPQQDAGSVVNPHTAPSTDVGRVKFRAQPPQASNDKSKTSKSKSVLTLTAEIPIIPHTNIEKPRIKSNSSVSSTVASTNNGRDLIFNVDKTINNGVLPKMIISSRFSKRKRAKIAVSNTLLYSYIVVFIMIDVNVTSLPIFIPGSMVYRFHATHCKDSKEKKVTEK